MTLNKNEAKVTMRDLPDKPGVAARIFKVIAGAGISVDMIVQNISRIGFTDLSFTVVKEKEMLDKAIDVVKSFCGDLCEPGKGILFAIPLAFVDGLPQEG